MSAMSNLFEQASVEWEAGNLLSAFELFQRSAAQGDPASQNNVGYFYDKGLGVKADREKAKFWYKKAIENGEMSACSNLASLYISHGEIDSAIHWLGKAISSGDGDAALMLAKLYLNESPFYERHKAKEYLELVLISDSVTQDSLEEAKDLLKAITERRE